MLRCLLLMFGEMEAVMALPATAGEQARQQAVTRRGQLTSVHLAAWLHVMRLSGPFAPARADFLTNVCARASLLACLPLTNTTAYAQLKQLLLSRAFYGVHTMCSAEVAVRK